MLRGIVFGMLGGLAGLLAMDVVMLIEFLIVGLPLDTYLVQIGSVFSGGAILGVILHLMLGAGLGLAFSALVLTVDAFRIETVRKGVVLGFLAGLITIPLGCVPFALLINMPVLELLGFSTIPHLAWGVGLGVVAGYGLRTLER
jgi:hypothetical protein